MAVLVDSDTRLAVAGVTGREGSFHTLNNRAYGTNVVGGVNARKAGTTVDFGDTTLPVYGTVAEAMAALVIANAFVEKFGGDSLAELRRNYDAYLSHIATRLRG